jgi:hypothetical protein
MPKGLSLHVGLNSVDPKHYDGWSGPLTACEADAEDMEAIATDQGYTTSICKTKAATRDAVRDGISKAAKDLGAGDIFLLTYSGHGGQVRDVNGDEPDDLMDETWCLYDGELIDDELYVLWQSFRAGVRVLVLSDSCHSGSVTKVALSNPDSASTRAVLEQMGVREPFVFRAMPNDVALRVYRKHARFYDGLQPRAKRKGKTRKQAREERAAAEAAVKASVRLLSGCQDNQLSLDGTFNGLFTGTLRVVWDDGRFDGNYAAFHRAIVRRMPATQTPNHFMVGAREASYDRQRPFEI